MSHQPYEVFRTKCGFTLVEVLVVITIIAVLAGLVFKVVAPARTTAQQAQCASNLRQLGLALNLYIQENGNEFPATSHANDETTWFKRLTPFLQNAEKVAICPADPYGERRLAAGQSSYILNEFVGVTLTDPFGRVKENFRNRLSLPSPARTMVLMPAADAIGVNTAHDHTHSRKWTSWRAVLADVQVDRFHSGRAAEDHTDGRANYLYADGHVESLDATWMKNEIEARRNPARPPR